MKLPTFFKLSLLFAILAPTLTFVVLYAPVQSKQIAIVQRPVLGDTSPSPTHQVRFFEKNFFITGEEALRENQPFVSLKSIRGGITPHHLLPGTILSRFFYAVSQKSPSTIIIIGPNHSEAGQASVLTSQYDWETPFGTTFHDHYLTNEFVSMNIATVDEKVVPADHSVTATIPYIKRYLPNTKVVPLLVSNTMNIEEIKQLSDQLARLLPSDTVVVASVDFSHYLNANEADEKDQVTFELMQNYDYERLLSLNNDYTDAPATIILFLELMKTLNSRDTVLLDHTNSGHLTRDPFIETTSYFSILFGEK